MVTKPGRFISFEGPEGGGKTTQARLLGGRLEAAGLEVVYTREPGGTVTGEAIRTILQDHRAEEAMDAKAEVLLFAASRAQLVAHVIRPALERGAWVVCDRFADSTTAYQGYGRDLGAEAMLAINRFAVDGVMPDVTFLLDLEVEAGFRRVHARQQAAEQPLDRMEQESRAFHERVRAGYHELAARWPERFRTLDAAGAPEPLAALIWETIEREFSL